MIAITGSNGFIGQRLLAALKSNAIPIDLRRQSDNEIRRLLESSECSTIAHLANPMPSKESVKQDLVRMKTKALSVRLLELIEPLGKFHILFLSSIRVYNSNSAVITENSPLQPVDGYGSGKLAAEKILSSSAHKISCIRATSIQGVDHKGFPRGILGTFAQQAKLKGIISVMGNGNSVKDLLHISDLIDLLTLIIRIRIPMNKFFLPVGGGNNTITILDLAQKIAHKTGASIKHIEPDKYDLSGKVDNDPIQLLTGWKPRLSLGKMIEETVNAI